MPEPGPVILILPIELELQVTVEVSGASIIIPVASMREDPSLIIEILVLPVSLPILLFDMFTPVAFAVLLNLIPQNAGKTPNVAELPRKKLRIILLVISKPVVLCKEISIGIIALKSLTGPSSHGDPVAVELLPPIILLLMMNDDALAALTLIPPNVYGPPKLEAAEIDCV